MILLDTHIWIWWVHGDERLDVRLASHLSQAESQGLGVSPRRAEKRSAFRRMGFVTRPITR